MQACKIILPEDQHKRNEKNNPGLQFGHQTMEPCNIRTSYKLQQQMNYPSHELGLQMVDLSFKIKSVTMSG